MRKIWHADHRPKQKPQRREPAGSSPIIGSIGKRTWTDIEPGKYSFSDYEVSKKVMHLLRHSLKVHQEEDGAVHFCRIKEHLQHQFPHSPHSLTVSGKYAWLEEEEIREDFQYCTDSSGTIVCFRALPGHSGRNLIDPSLQDNVVIQSNFFQYIYHVGCAFNLHSIISSGFIRIHPNNTVTIMHSSIPLSQFVSFVSELLCALDKSSNTLVLAQACREKHSAFAHVHNRKENFLTW